MARIRYVGGLDAVEFYAHADTSIDEVNDAGWVTVSPGEVVDVPDFVAFGLEPVPGTYVLDDEEHEFLHDDDVPFGAVVLTLPDYGTSGLLAQPDNWQLAEADKAEADPEGDDK